MRTPAGTECPYYYADYFRGREYEECRLVEPSQSGRSWSPDVCERCPVPEIVRANGCKHMSLHASIESGFLGFGQKVVVTAYCARAGEAVKEPLVGCGHCHEDLPSFSLAPPEENIPD
ncbi:MAG: hypothetical protein JXA25_15565 [Anaerolineales bacterium]|nr:hypothetical protein [Anaerolineales bacterium]